MRRSLCLILLGVCLSMLAAPAAFARTWRVAPLGTVDCDFRDIQPAVEAASPGDTISIAPGWYSTLHTITAPAWTEETIVAVTKDNLTFIGAGAGRTYIGMPHYYSPEGAWPKVFCSVEPHDVTIRDLTILNMKTGIYWWQGRLTISGCSFQDLGGAVACWADNGQITDCQFDVANGGAAITCALNDAYTIERCSFAGLGQGIVTGERALNVTVADCTFSGNSAAIIYDRGSTGTIRNVTITDAHYSGVTVSINSHATLDNVSIECGVHAGFSCTGVLVSDGSSAGLESVRTEGGDFGMWGAAGATVTGRNVVTANTSTAAIFMSAPRSISLHQSHFLPASGLAVDVVQTGGAYVVLDLTGNYWGVADAGAIAALIRDGNDAASNRAYVDYVPFAGGEVPTETTTWGGLKASFR